MIVICGCVPSLDLWNHHQCFHLLRHCCMFPAFSIHQGSVLHSKGQPMHDILGNLLLKSLWSPISTCGDKFKWDSVTQHNPSCLMRCLWSTSIICWKPLWTYKHVFLLESYLHQMLEEILLCHDERKASWWWHFFAQLFNFCYSLLLHREYFIYIVRWY